MVIEMADNTKSIPKGIVKNLLIRIDKFIFPLDFFILAMIEDYKMPIILGRPLLATTYAKVDILRKFISLEVGNEKVIIKMRRTKTGQEKSEEYESVEETNLEHRLHPAEKRVDWCETISQEKEGREIFNEGEEKEDHEEFKTNAVLEIILDKMDETWFSSTRNEKDDLEGMIDYLEPYLYNEFISLGNEGKCKLLGIIYREPPSILIKRLKLQDTIDKIPRTSANGATIRAVILDEMNAEGSAQGAIFLAASVILISSDSSDESVGSSISRIILFGIIPTEILIIPPRAPKARVTAVALPAGVLDLITYSSTDSDSSEDPPALKHAPRALSPTCVDLLPPRKRFRSSTTALSPEASIEGSIKIGSEEEDIDFDVMADIEADIAAKAAAAIEFRVEINVGFEGDDEAEEKAESSTKGTVKIGFDRIVEPMVPYEILRITDIKEEHRTWEIWALADEREMTRLHERVIMLEGSNMRLRGGLAEERERADSIGRHLSDVQEETMTITRSGMTPEAIKEMISRRVAEALAESNMGPIVKSESENGDDNENGNGGGRRNGSGGRRNCRNDEVTFH
nr:hypothetical protein [Tanacetum cinerariifolium]